MKRKKNQNQNLLNAAIKRGQKSERSKGRSERNKNKKIHEYQRFSNATQRQLKEKPP